MSFGSGLESADVSWVSSCICDGLVIGWGLSGHGSHISRMADCLLGDGAAWAPCLYLISSLASSHGGHKVLSALEGPTGQ